jgi:xanthosine utilization system XapX-like protein
MYEAGTFTVIWVPVSEAGTSGVWAPNSTVSPETKFCPVSVRTKPGPPAIAAVGLMVVSVLVVMKKLTELEFKFALDRSGGLVVEFVTQICPVATIARSLAGMAAASDVEVELVQSVGRVVAAVVLPTVQVTHHTAFETFGTNPVPVSVMGRLALPPAVALGGLTEIRVGELTVNGNRFETAPVVPPGGFTTWTW